MQDWIIWIASTAFVSLVGFLLGILQSYNEVVAGIAALIICVVVLVYIMPMAF